MSWRQHAAYGFTWPWPCLSRSTTHMSTMGPRLVNVSITVTYEPWSLLSTLSCKEQPQQWESTEMQRVKERLQHCKQKTKKHITPSIIKSIKTRTMLGWHTSSMAQKKQMSHSFIQHECCLLVWSEAFQPSLCLTYIKIWMAAKLLVITCSYNLNILTDWTFIHPQRNVCSKNSWYRL